LYRDLQELEKVWVDVQSSRSRDAIYLYLARVYKIVFAWQRRQCVKKLVARTQAWAGHRVDRRAEPYAVVIAATTEAKELDGKTISKWSRALRFIRRYKQRRISLKVFARRHGGINGCAAEFAARSGRQTATH
jgi:hypothetical protein